MKIKDIISTGKKATRDGFGDGLHEAGKKNPNVVALCADLVGSLKMNKFIDENPERFFQMGISEANMMGVAAGLAIGGKIPFTGTFANFSTARVFDQVRQSIAYSDKNVKICASHAGLTLGEDGATHQTLEDVGMMKMLPGMTVINPCDYHQTVQTEYRLPIALNRTSTASFTGTFVNSETTSKLIISSDSYKSKCLISSTKDLEFDTLCTLFPKTGLITLVR